MPEDYSGTPIPDNQNPNPGNQDDNIPEWMKDAGWGKDSGTFDESKPIFDNLDDGDEDEIVPADIPAWLEDAAPEGFSINPNATPAFEAFSEDEPYITTGDLIPRTPPEDKEDKPEPVSPPPVPEPEPPAKEPELDIPSWLKNLELDEDSQETAVAWLENMPESLRATEEEKAASMVKAEPEIPEPVDDELAWLDELSGAPAKQEEVTTAALSEDLVASELIPEQGDLGQLFDQDEIQSIDNNAPDWLRELGDSEQLPPTPEAEDLLAEPEKPAIEAASSQPADDDVNMLPDWLSDLGSDQAAQEPESMPEPEAEQPTGDSGELPAWLGEFETGSAEEEEETSTSLDWLDSLAAKDASPVGSDDLEDFSDLGPESEGPGEELEPQDSFSSDVSPNDETLNTQVPDWLSKIGEIEEDQEAVEDAGAPLSTDSGDTSSWLDQIDVPGADESGAGPSAGDGEVLDWLEKMEDEPAAESTPIDDLRQSLSGEMEADAPVELETAKYLREEDKDFESSDALPDWLAELSDEGNDEPTSLESAIRQSDHLLSDEEKEFLDRVEETQDENADWLAKLDLTEEGLQETEPPALKVDLPEDEPSLAAAPDEFEEEEDDDLSGGMLDRLRESSEPAEPEVPQWLENLKKEEDPQETAILWLKQFVERGTEANLQDEIKRYTDELNPGDTVPKWMEDLKHEEDPQTTAMLWLEKLAGERPAPEKPKVPRTEEEDNWLADLEREAAKQTKKPEELPENDFQDASEGWLADLEIDEKIKSEEQDLPDWSSAEAKEPQSDTPSWMKATSPLEGDFHTDELAGRAEKEVEIPAWLAGYGEGEEPEEEDTPEPRAEESEQDEYAWVSESEAEAEAPAPTRAAKEPIDLNKAAISQLESILGISYQVARGIVVYREKQGPFKELDDLLNVPEITDEQTIEILKPEVFIKPAVKKPAPKPAGKTKDKDVSLDERLQLAKALMDKSQISEALEHYSFLIKKKKSISQVIEELIQATADHPVDISILKVLGDAYMRIDKLDEALDAYSKAEDLLR